VIYERPRLAPLYGADDNANQRESDAFNVQVIEEARMPSVVDQEIPEFICMCFPEEAGTFRAADRPGADPETSPAMV
jgi:hypothetical protein